MEDTEKDGRHGGPQSITPSRNHCPTPRSTTRRYTVPSVMATSHSSRSQAAEGADDPRAAEGTEDPRATEGTEAIDLGPGVFHHSPEVRHGPAATMMAPLVKPCRSVWTRTGRPSVTTTRTGMGNRKRRRADFKLAIADC